MRAFLERVEEEGLVRGWCWCPDEPERRVRLQVLVDNQPVGVTVADLLREDLKAAGIGDGHHAFNFLLPWEAVSGKSASQITLADAATGRVLPASTIFRRPTIRPIEDRLRELEHQVRLLHARLDDAGRRAHRDKQVVGAMLGTIGAFFTRLSEATIESIPTALVPSLTDLVDITAARLPPLTLAAPDAPELTLVIDAAGTMDNIYACLRSIQAAELDQTADIVLLDDGAVIEAALFPALVQNLRYWRLQPGQSIITARNRIAALTPDRPIAFLAPSTRLSAAWWPALRATFAREPLCAVLCTKLVHPAGMVASAALLPDLRGQLTDFAQARHEHDPYIDCRQAVIAATDAALLIDGRHFAVLGGFDPAFIDPAAAAIAFCIGCWETGRLVLYQPQAALRWQDDGVGLPAAHPLTDPDTADLLAQRWFAASPAAWPVPVGDALVIDDATADAAPTNAPVAMAEALCRLGWRVSFGVIGRLETEDPRAPYLRSIGIQVLRAPFHPSISAAIEAADRKFGLIQLTAASVLTLPPARIRALAPDALVFLCLDGSAPPPLALLHEAVEASHCTLVGNVRLAASFPPSKIRRIGALLRPGFTQRAGLALILPTESASARPALRWFTRALWPGLREALPGLVLHVREQDAEESPADAILHPPERFGPDLWHTLRLAIAPLRRATPDPSRLALCLEAGLPVFACGGAWPSPPPGVVLGATTPRAIIREIALTYGDPVRWQALHDSIDDPTPSAEDWARGFQTLLGAFKPPSTAPGTKQAA